MQMYNNGGAPQPQYAYVNQPQPVNPMYLQGGMPTTMPLPYGSLPPYGGGGGGGGGPTMMPMNGSGQVMMMPPNQQQQQQQGWAPPGPPQQGNPMMPSNNYGR